ncbi:hypothetical protein [Parafrankia sp. FMc2]|uniref:hypothetical protein n=1 Tax=Parafrankia sp. FMc2 TaxID=3233196 RepID=UPI0034D5560C
MNGLDALTGPTAGELAAIEAEWPQLAADLAEIDRDIDVILARDAGVPLVRIGGAGQGKTSPAAAVMAVLPPGWTVPAVAVRRAEAALIVAGAGVGLVAS